MKIITISDQHGNLPDLPSCDLLIIAGDICPTGDHSLSFQESWMETNFKYWLKNIDAREKIFICGNHDFLGESRPQLIRKMFENDKSIHFLQDSYCYIGDWKIFGTPFTPYFFGWAFNLYEPDLKKKWADIPNDTDILVVHGPPHGYGDLAPRLITDDNETDWPGGEHVGSPSLMERIREVKPKLVVCGHIHSGYNQYVVEDTRIVNCSLVNEKYQMVNSPMAFNLEIVDGKKTSSACALKE